MTIGERIKNARINANLKQTELAEKIGVSKQTLYKYENGIVTNIPSDKIELIAAACKVSPSCLMGWNNEAACLKLFNRLDETDQARILERMETMLEADKYKEEATPHVAEIA